MRRITLTAQTLVHLLGCGGFEVVGEAYARPMVKIPVKTSFCGWLVLRRQRIGIGCGHVRSLASCS